MSYFMTGLCEILGISSDFSVTQYNISVTGRLSVSIENTFYNRSVYNMASYYSKSVCPEAKTSTIASQLCCNVVYSHTVIHYFLSFL